MDKKSDFDLINQSWESSKNDLFGGDSSLDSSPFSISSSLDSMASPLGGLDDNRDILGSGSSFSGLDMHHGMDDVLGSSISSFAKPDVLQNSLSGLDSSIDLHDKKNDFEAFGTSDLLKQEFASGSSLTDFSHSLDNLGKSDTGIQLGSLGVSLLGDYGNRDYQSEFLSGSQISEKSPAIEKSPFPMDGKSEDLFSPDNHDDVLSVAERTTLPQSVVESSIMETPDKPQLSLTNAYTPAEIARTPIAEPEPTIKELVPVTASVDIQEDAYQSDESDDDDEVYFDNFSSEEQYFSNNAKDLKTEDSSDSDSVEIGLFAQQEFESNWFGEYSENSTYNTNGYDAGYRSSMNNLAPPKPDNYDYNYTGMQVSDAGWVAEDIAKYQSRENIGCGVIVVCVIMFFFAGVWAGFALIAIAGIITGAVVSSKAGNRAKELFKTYYVEATLKKNFYLKSYQPNIVLGEDLNRLELTTQEWNRSKVDDLVEGLYKGVRFIFKDIALDYNSGGKNSTTKNIFRGQIYETTIKPPLSLNIKYVRNLSPEMEYSGINCYYKRYGSSDSIGKIESQQFVDAMVKLYNDLPVVNLEVRLMGNCMRIVVETSEEWFELSGSLEDSVERLNSQIGRMMVVVDFMKNCGIVFDKVRA